MVLYKGNTELSKIYRGNTEISKIFRGQTEVYTASSTGASTTAWITSDDSGNLFYTQADNGQSGWTDTGVNLGTGYLQDAVYNGSVWVAGTDDGIYQTSDTTATSGWSQVDSTGTARSIMWTGNGWVASIDGDVKYTTDTTGATGWTSYSGVTGTDTHMGLANDGTQIFLAIRAGTSDFYSYSSTDFTGSLNRSSGPLSNFARNVFYDTVNSRYILTGKDANIVYATSINGSWTNPGNAFDSNGISRIEYNGSYYCTIDSFTEIRTDTSPYSTSWSSTNLNGFNVDRVNGPHWNGTAWMVGMRTTSGTTVLASRADTNPNGTWTGVSAPTGFQNNRSVGCFPSKRPYYNTLTNLGY